MHRWNIKIRGPQPRASLLTNPHVFLLPPVLQPPALLPVFSTGSEDRVSPRCIMHPERCTAGVPNARGQEAQAAHGGWKFEIVVFRFPCYIFYLRFLLLLHHTTGESVPGVPWAGTSFCRNSTRGWIDFQRTPSLLWVVVGCFFFGWFCGRHNWKARYSFGLAFFFSPFLLFRSYILRLMRFPV